MSESDDTVGNQEVKIPSSSRNGDVIKVMFDDAHLPAFSVDPANEADDVHGWFGSGEGGHSSFADVLRDPAGMEASHPGHTFETENTYEIVLLNEGEKITKEALEDIDVLVVPMTFNGRYQTSEIDEIEQFVKSGGGLLLIADHSSFPVQMDEIALRFFVRWGNNVVTDVNDYTGPHNYWIVYEDNGVPGDDNMPTNDVPNFEDDPDRIFMITQNAPTVQYYCSNAYTLENPTESRKIIITDTDGSSNYNGEPACLAIPNGNCTGAGRAVFIPDCNVFGDSYDCDEDGKVDFWDEHNAEFGLGIIDWLAPRAYEVALISGEKDPHTGLPKPLVHIYEPGERHTFEIEVWNLGLRNDVIELEIPEMPENWSAQLDIEETEELETREFELVYLTVTAPLTNVTDGDYALINVTATSSNDPENATAKITSTNVITVDIGFNVNWAVQPDVNDEKRLVLDPGKVTVTTLGINNIGNINDTYSITLKGIPGGWEVSPDLTLHPEWSYDEEKKCLSGIHLSSYHFEENTTGISFLFTPPLDAKEGDTAIVTAIGESYLSILTEQDARGKHDDDVILEVSANRAMEISCSEPLKYIDPGKTVSFLVSVQNNGNSREQVQIELGPMIPGWTATVDSPTVILQARQKKTVTVTMWAPEDALEGSRAVLEVSVELPSVGKVVDSLALTAIVNRYCQINASLLDDEFHFVDPGEKVSLNISIGNPGNGPTSAFLTMANLPSGWDFEFLLMGQPVTNKNLEAGDNYQIRLDISVPHDALADADPDSPGFDPYSLLINVSGEENHIALPLSFMVNRKAAISVFTGDDLEITEPGSWAVFYVCVKNEGNAWDEILVSLDDIPVDEEGSSGLAKEWEVFFTSVALIEQASGVAEFSRADFSRLIDTSPLTADMGFEPNNSHSDLVNIRELTLRLPIGGIAWVGITAEVPHYAASRDTSFNISSECLSSAKVRPPPIECRVSIRNADLGISGGISLSAPAKAGELISVMVHIKNVGDIRAENVQLRLYEDDAVIATMPIRTILAGKTQFVAFTWKVPNKDSCKLKVVIDPDHHIAEKSRHNNKAETDVNISGSSILFSLGYEGILWGVLGAIILALLALGINMFLRRRRFRRSL